MSRTWITAYLFRCCYLLLFLLPFMLDVALSLSLFLCF